jgi:hypothetical protein
MGLIGLFLLFNLLNSAIKPSEQLGVALFEGFSQVISYAA